jgi:mono/diheme cytochrome c family protein
MKMSLSKGLVLVTMTMVGCEDTINLDPIDNTPPREATVRPPPISGGTLAVTSEGLAVASDPERDRVSIVDLATEEVITVALSSGDEPGRVIEGSDGTVHVVLRGAGALLTLDTADGSVVERRDVCPEPRGVALHAAEGRLYVACVDGTLVDMPEVPGAAVNQQRIEADLRDVVVSGGNVLVSTFRSAELIAATGVTGRNAPGTIGEFQPHVAWRTVTGPLGEVVMLHQLATTAPVPIEPTVPDDVGRPDGGGDGGGSPYGGGGFCDPGVNQPAISIFSGTGVTTMPHPSAALAVDVAMSPDGQFVAMATPGAGPDGAMASVVFAQDGGGCFGGEFGPGSVPGGISGDSQVTAVAWDGSSRLIMQSREPAGILVQTGNEPMSPTFKTIDLGGESKFDTGHELFHRQTSAGVSCASCHPDGTDDGHVWNFEQLGPRRTQPLDVGLRDTAPFHWDGDMNSFGTLVEEVFNHRMGGHRQSAARTDSFANWLFELKRPAVAAPVELSVADQGKGLFAAYACTACHSGDRLSNNATVTIWDADLQVPSLRRVSTRAPFMHDGRSRTLDEAVWDMLDSTVEGHHATTAEVAAISEYLRTL